MAVAVEIAQRGREAPGLHERNRDARCDRHVVEEAGLRRAAVAQQPHVHRVVRLAAGRREHHGAPLVRVQVEPAVAVVVADLDAESDVRETRLDGRTARDRVFAEVTSAVVDEQEEARGADRRQVQVGIAVAVEIAEGRGVGVDRHGIETRVRRAIVEAGRAGLDQAVAEEQTRLAEPGREQIEIAIAVDVRDRGATRHPLGRTEGTGHQQATSERLGLVLQVADARGERRVDERPVRARRRRDRKSQQQQQEPRGSHRADSRTSCAPGGILS